MKNIPTPTTGRSPRATGALSAAAHGRRSPASGNHPGPLPEVVLLDRQRAVALDAGEIARAVARALPRACALSRRRGGVLHRLERVECSLVGLRTMARVHLQFLGLPGPTDVITFPYGEILVCPAVAARNAPSFGASPSTETTLYLIHGLLHLAGLDDVSPRDARVMARTQSALLRICVPAPQMPTGSSSGGRTGKRRGVRRREGM